MGNVVNDCTIKTEREAALPYNGKQGKFVRDVGKGDLAFNNNDEPQVVVLMDAIGRDLIGAPPDGKRELYFYANEVIPNKASEKAKSEAKPLTGDALAKADNAAFAEAGATNTVAAYDGYLANYPSGAHVAEANARRAALQSAAAAQKPSP